MISLTKEQRQSNEMAAAAARYGQKRFEEYARSKGFGFNEEESEYKLCAVKRNHKRSICEVLLVWRTSEKNNPKAVLTADGWVEYGWLISLKGIIRYRPQKSKFRVYALARKY